MSTSKDNQHIVDYVTSHKLEMTYAQLADKFKRTEESIRGIIKRAQLTHHIIPIGGSSLSKEIAMKPKDKVNRDLTLSRLRDGKKEVDSHYKVALRKVHDLEREKVAILDIKGGVKPVAIRPGKERGSEAVALWIASDWHVGEKVTYGQTNGLNEYNPTIAKARGEAFFRNGLRLTKLQNKGVHIDTVILALLGDFITGHLHLDAVENNYLPPVEETILAQNIIIAGIEYVLKHSTYKLVIPCHSGNHGRTTKFSHFGSENGHSLEYFMYQSIANYFRNEPRVSITIPEGSHSYVDVFGRKVRFLHGHDVKFNGGSGGITIPLNKAIAQWDKACPAFLTCLGHFHQKFDGGNFLVNGSLIGYNAFALSIKASAEKAVQTFALIDKKQGKTIVAPIFLDE